MFFNSIEFLLFFPVVTVLYFLLAHRYRWIMLLAASCVFYMAFIPAYILIIFSLIIIDFTAGLLIEKSTRHKRLFLIISIIATCSVLVSFKYFNLFATTIHSLTHFSGLDYKQKVLSIILPLGLSYHTFQSLAYVIEVYRGNFKAEKNLGIYSLYVMFYPQLVAGPIERPYNLLVQLKEKHDFDYDRFTSGIKLMAWGMFKKIVIADRLGKFVDQAFLDPSEYHNFATLISLIFFFFQVYCDFSGYSDIAIGSARVMGFKLMRNFDRPFSSTSFTEYWNRWHISLSTWFRDYIFYSLPIGKKKKWYKSRILINIMITFILMGFWHGAQWNYVLWGIIIGGYLVIEIITEKSRRKITESLGIDKHQRLKRMISQITIFLLMTLTMPVFRANHLSDIPVIYAHLFSTFHLKNEILFIMVWQTKAFHFFLIISLLLLENLQSRYNLVNWVGQKPIAFRWSLYLGLIFIILFLGVFNKNEFIYFQF